MSDARLHARPAVMAVETGRWLGRRTMSLTASSLVEARGHCWEELPFVAVDAIRLERVRDRYSGDALRLVFTGAGKRMAIAAPSAPMGVLAGTVSASAVAAFAREAIGRVVAVRPGVVTSEGLGYGAWWGWTSTAVVGVTALAGIVLCVVGIALGIVSNPLPFALLPAALFVAKGLVACSANIADGNCRAVTPGVLIGAFASLETGVTHVP